VLVRGGLDRLRKIGWQKFNFSIDRIFRVLPLEQNNVTQWHRPGCWVDGKWL